MANDIEHQARGGTTLLSQESLAICDEHYGGCGKNNGCHRCPIHAQCTSMKEWSHAGLDRWREEINRASARVVREKS